ncbi:MAG: MBL fold metallo-hydrolase, partial [Firmicutes bacterium]|nr:MBL fold metallo-hydrolase [Bacillota bacterium]
AARMGLELSGVKAAFLSHAHNDHAGGFPAFFAANQTAKVYLQQGSERDYLFKVFVLRENIGIPAGILDTYADRFVYVDGALNVENGIRIVPHSDLQRCLLRARQTHMYTRRNGRLSLDDFSHEQTVVFEEEDGLVCINSCSHAGIEQIIEEVRQQYAGKRIKAFFGGFHLMGLLGAGTCGYSRKEVESLAQQLMKSSDAVFYSGHCTGTVAFAWMKEVMKDRLQPMAAGKTFEV